MSYLRIGIDLGGTKTEGVLMQPDGNIYKCLRLPTPKYYTGILETIAGLVAELETASDKLNVGICTPGSISNRTGLMRNSNSVCLNGKPIQVDLEKHLGRKLRIANDANCLALSEANDGAGAAADVVFAVIIGTGCGGGISYRGQIHTGINSVGGEWGHVPLPWRSKDELPGELCYCGNSGCNETFISGTGLEKDYQRATNTKTTARDITRLAAEGDAEAEAALCRYEQRLARALALIVNILDPDVIVLGGGMSNIERLYSTLPELIYPWIFGGDFSTPIRQAQHGDSSGVRGAAWLWQPEEAFTPLRQIIAGV